jgi:hypothetical protein
MDFRQIEAVLGTASADERFVRVTGNGGAGSDTIGMAFLGDLIGGLSPVQRRPDGTWSAEFYIADSATPAGRQTFAQALADDPDVTSVEVVPAVTGA